MKVEHFNNFRSNVRFVMADNGISQRALGESSGLSYAYINRILQGSVNPSIDVCETIANALDTPFVKLLEKSKEFQKKTTVET